MIPVNRGVTGKITKLFGKYLNNIAGNYDIEELQKTATLGTARLLRKRLMQNFTTFITRNKIACTKKHNRRIIATLYTLEA
jgi:hypothetical protein